MKTGTTALYNIFDCHPEICMSIIKEPNYYCDDLWSVSHHISSIVDDRNKIVPGHNAIIKDIDTYLGLFSKCQSDVLYYGESSPSYLRSMKSAKNIFSDSPNAKIIIILRDPIERAWSHYLMEKCELRVPCSFKELVDFEFNSINNKQVTQHGIIESGLYFKNISRYTACFPMENIMIIDSSEIYDNLDSLFRRINLFLGLSVNQFPKTRTLTNITVTPRIGYLNKVFIKYGIKNFIRSFFHQSIIDRLKYFFYKKPPGPSKIDQETFSKLLSFYYNDVKDLARLLGSNNTYKWMDKYINIKQ